MDLQNITQQTVDEILKIFKAGGSPYSGPVAKDITQATGLVAYNLEPAAKLLVPAITPLRNMIPRVANTRGGTAANWKVITSIDINRKDVFTAEGTKAGTVSYTVSDKSGSFKTISKGDNVSFQAQWAGKTFEDVKAKMIGRLLKHVMIHEEQAILGGRNAALGTVTAPTVNVTDGGGTIADATYNVIVRAVTNLGRGKKSAATGTGALANGGDSSIDASTPWVEGAVRYEWYVGTAGNEKLEATTQINSMKITALLGTGAAAPADDSADTLAFDGLLAQLTAATAQVTTLATGTNGTGTDIALSDIDGVLQNIWDVARADPDVMFVPSQQSIRITNLVLAANGGPTLYVQNDASDAGKITGGYRVTHYLNKVTGKPIPLITHPYMQAGTVLVGTFEMPFPASDIVNPIEIETRQEYMQLDYPQTSPKWESEILVDELVKLFFPGSWGVIRNIAPKTS